MCPNCRKLFQSLVDVIDALDDYRALRPVSAGKRCSPHTARLVRECQKVKRAFRAHLKATHDIQIRPNPAYCPK